MEGPLSLTIDDRKLSALPGQTILEVAQENGIYIPTLCHHPKTAPYGGCRICVVEVEKARTLVASCCMPAANGMVVRTDTPRVQAARRMIVELLWAAGDHNCLTCEKNGACTLQDLVYKFKIEKPRFPVTPPGHPIEDNNAMIRRDLNRCILCGRCVRVCNEVQVNEILDFARRGSRVTVGPAFDSDYKNSACYFCGDCVDACPVGAITFKQARFAGRPWELKKVRTTCPYCGVGCQMDLNVSDNRLVTVTGNASCGPPNEGSLCVKGRFGYDFVNHPSRLKTPLIRRDRAGEFRQATWDEAYDYISERLQEIKRKWGPEKIAGLSSARCTNEENYLFQKFMRAAVGTNHVDHCARL